MIRFLSFLLVCSMLLTSCEKEENALVLPPAGTASHAMLEMGSDYEHQIYFDFETGKEVLVSDPKSWHLAFQSDANGRHIYMNGGNNVFTYNTHEKDFDQVDSLPAGLGSNGSGWQFDAPSGNPDSTGIGDWFYLNGESKGEVYIVQVEPGRNVKMRILYADSKVARLEWAPLESKGGSQTIEIPKNTEYSFAYFSFDAGVVNPEPDKYSWDVVFTRYRYVYHTPAYPNFPYEVSGVLLNPYNTLATMDSVHSFEQIDLQMASACKLSPMRDMIGFDWKTYSSNGRYEVNRSKNFIIQTRNNHIFKLRFLDFYNSSGVKGSPSFEFERLK